LLQGVETLDELEFLVKINAITCKAIFSEGHVRLGSLKRTLRSFMCDGFGRGLIVNFSKEPKAI
jgi:hypothetical protein